MGFLWRFYGLQYGSYFVFHISEAQFFFVVTDSIYGLRYESYFVFHILEAQRARFQRQVSTLSQNASCVHIYHLATTVQ